MRGRRRAPAQHLKVVTIHRQNQVEALEVTGFDDARAQRREVVAAAGGRLPGTRIGVIRGDDVRDLVRDLANTLRVRVEMKQIGARDPL